MQSYDFIHKDNGFSEVFVLNFLKSNNSKVFMDNFPYLCDIYVCIYKILRLWI